MCKKVFISQPMNGKSNEDILAERNRIAKKFINAGWEVIDTILDGSIQTSPIEYLGESIKRMGNANLVFMMKGWQKARGCRIEHEVAVHYGKDIRYE